MNTNDIIDTCGLSCPQPMLMVKKVMEERGAGSLRVLADATASHENISRIAQHLGWDKVADTVEDGIFSMEFSKQA